MEHALFIILPQGSSGTLAFRSLSILRQLKHLNAATDKYF